MKETHDTVVHDSQGTAVRPIPVEEFDLDKYAEYVRSRESICRSFWGDKSGLIVHRRFRVPEVFSAGCEDMAASLSLQLSALKTSMDYAMDVPNFLEPWYGIGTVASAFGADYRWEGALAPAAVAPFQTVEDALAFDPSPIEKTRIGRHIVNMVEFFLEKTKGKIPLSLSDVQSPFNAAASLVDTTAFLLAVVDAPHHVRRLMDIVVELSVEFYTLQAEMIGDLLVRPGHGFSSSRVSRGIGSSDDSSTMLSPEMFAELCLPAFERFGESFGGTAYHSCGDWSEKVPRVAKIRGLTMVDGAFTRETDPDPNTAGAFRNGFGGTEIVVNARMVGDHGRIVETARELSGRSGKLIVVTYCRTAEEQKRIYEELHAGVFG